ncbi:hypothetical protein APTSU1_001245500 [Apodemus speciosus]|uniref:Uncharacterized protein n=1 Tax=Apodemus speciosus TaxID=105296 RepID=A0ABQ0FDA0_APOSI
MALNHGNPGPPIRVRFIGHFWKQGYQCQTKAAAKTE